MSARDVTVTLRHMLDAARRAGEIAAGIERVDLAPDHVPTLALTRLVEIVGEASRRVPDAVRSDHPEIPWREMAGTRDRLIHGYDEVDLDILWTIVTSHLPALVGQVETALKSIGDPSP